MPQTFRHTIDQCLNSSTVVTLWILSHVQEVASSLVTELTKVNVPTLKAIAIPYPHLIRNLTDILRLHLLVNALAVVTLDTVNHLKGICQSTVMGVFLRGHDPSDSIQES